tara:strand:+ start:307 stop:726 length:420 start_codon:yes stop_codon:yes gene_type:complete
MSERTIEEYRKIVAARPVNEKRALQSRHQHLMNQKPTRPARRNQINKYKEDVLSGENKHKTTMDLVKIREVSFVDMQVARDEALGKYESRSFLESVLRHRGIEPEEEIEDMLEQYRLSKREKPMAAVASISWDDLLEEE